MYIHQSERWPHFHWDDAPVALLSANVRHRQGRLLGRMEGLGFSLQEQATLETITLDVIKTSEIEGEILQDQQVRSSLARRMGIDIAGLVPSERHVDGVVEMMLDATQRYQQPLTDDRLFGWHSALFPMGRSNMRRLVAGAWRTGAKGPMQVVSGAPGREKVHFEAPAASRLHTEMGAFLDWFNSDQTPDPVLKAALAHLWFVTVHPFEDGNGRIARAIADLQLCRADGLAQRFYSMSAQIRLERKGYYEILENTQRASLDVTAWMVWFLNCLDKAITAADTTLETVLHKARVWEMLATKSLNTRQRLIINRLLSGFEGKLTNAKWVKIAKCSPATALRDIQNLIEQNVLRKEVGGGRSTSYTLIL